MKFLYSHFIRYTMQRKIVSCPAPRIFNYNSFYVNVTYESKKFGGHRYRVFSTNLSAELPYFFIADLDNHPCEFMFYNLKIQSDDGLFDLSQHQYSELQKELMRSSSFVQTDYISEFNDPLLMSIEYLSKPYEQQKKEFYLVQKQVDKKSPCDYFHY